MRVGITICLLALAACASMSACGEQLAASGDGEGEKDGGRADGSDIGALDGASDSSADGNGNGDVVANADACTPPGFCLRFESESEFGGPYAVSQSNGGNVSITASSPHEGVGALHTVVMGGSGFGEATATRVAVGSQGSFDCTMWLRAPLGWSGSFEVLSIGAFPGDGGYDEWRIALGVASADARGKVSIGWATRIDGGADGNAQTAGPIEATATGGWVQARLHGSRSGGWNLQGTIGGATTSVTAPDPGPVTSTQFFIGIHRASYASAQSFQVDVDDVRCAITP